MDRPVIAAFDLDGTLTSGGSIVPFLVRACGARRVWSALAQEGPRFVRAGIVGGSSADAAKEALFERLLSGMPVADVEQAGKAFATHHLARHLRADTRARLEWHRAQRHHVLVVSASPECYVTPVAAQLGADAALATRLESAGGLLTGRVEGKNCRGAEKYARLMGWIRAAGMGGTDPVIWAYGNSRGDRWLLGAADHGIDAGRLGRMGRLRAFPRLSSLGEP